MRLFFGLRSSFLTTTKRGALTGVKDISSRIFISRFQTTKLQPVKKRLSLFRVLWRVSAIGLLGGVGYYTYSIYIGRHPRVQLDPDSSKKTLIVLGSGWASVSLLKSIDTENYNVVVISPRNYFLFTPLLPSCTTGTIEHRSIIEPLRHILRHKKMSVKFYEANCTKIDAKNRFITFKDESDVTGEVNETSISFDYLVIGTGSENSTFGVKGVVDYACFLKEIWDSQKIRTKIMDCVETATFKDQSPAEKKRLLHMVVVGGGPTGVEFAGELHDFFEQDLRKWIPEIADDFKVTLVEALPNVLQSFSKQLIDYTENVFKDEKISVHTKTMVKEVREKSIVAEVGNADGTKETIEIPYGLLVWATGNTMRPLVRDFVKSLGVYQKDARRGILVNDYLVCQGTQNIWALGDCASTKFAPTAQVASQQGSYLAGLFNTMAKSEILQSKVHSLETALHSETSLTAKSAIEDELRYISKSLRKVKQIKPFEYSHQGSLAYIGSDRAVADVSFFNGNFASVWPYANIS